jgi:hypothetical protein
MHIRKLHIIAIAISTSGCTTYNTYTEPQSNQPHAILRFEETGGSWPSRPWPMQLNGAQPASTHKRAFRIHTGALQLQVADHIETSLPFGPPAFPVYQCDMTFEALAGKTYTVSVIRERANQLLFVVIANAKTEVAKCRSILPDPIDRLMTRLDSSNAWKYGDFPRLDLPATATAEQLVAQTLKNGDVEKFEILITRHRTIPFDSKESYLIVLVDTSRGMKIVLFTYRNKESGWWNRMFDPVPPI